MAKERLPIAKHMSTKVKKQKNLFFLIISLSFLASVLIAWKIIYNFYSETKREAPNFALGILPLPKINGFKTREKNILYNFQNVSKESENLPKIIKVYKFKRKEIKKEEAEEIAAKFGFNFPPEEKFTSSTPSAFLYFQWKEKNQQLNISPLGEISYKYFPEDYSELKNPSFLASEEEAVKIVKEKIASLGFLENKTLLFKPFVNYIVLGPSEYHLASKKEETNGFEISLQPQIENIPILENNPESSFFSALLGNLNTIISLEANLFEVDFTLSGTYPLKNFQEVRNDLASGKGQVVYLEKIKYPLESQQEISISQVNIARINLAYFFDRENFYLYPIYVLSGIFNIEGEGNTAGIIYLYAL